VNRLDYPYDESFQPAMPVVEIHIDGYGARPAQTLTALIDSGADGTMLPIDVLQAVDALYADTVRMRGVLGDSESVDRYTVAIRLGPVLLPGINAVAIPRGGESILGRDALNQLALTLDGPAHTTQLTLES
jgi:hypothetical protein